MEPISLPSKIKYKPGKNKNEGRITIEPCYPGYGITLGNAIRRVLLSSLSGAAVIGIKIEGADHEFMSITNVKEDVLEIILNIKKLRMEIHSDDVEELELEVHGEKKVKASDIKNNPNVEIANPDLEISEITDVVGNLKFTIYVAKGRGYETIENRESEQKEIGYIELDSIFSPVISTAVNVENVRVGKMTNWDRLNLDIITDGTLTPEKAFKKSVKILTEQLNALIDESTSKKENLNEVEDLNIKKEIDTELNVDDKNLKIEIKKKDVIDEKPKKKRGRPRKDDK